MKKKTASKKNFGFDAKTEIGSWFLFPIPKPGFGCTLQEKKIFERKWANFALWNYIQQKVRFMSLCWFSIHELAWRTGDLESCFAIFESSELVKVAKYQNIFSIFSYLHINNKKNTVKGQKISTANFLGFNSSSMKWKKPAYYCNK